MQEWLLQHYLLFKALHIISVMSWMAGMLYLPRLFVYHAQLTPDSPTHALFKVMERRLLRYIINPAMIASLLFGVIMFIANPSLLHDGWMHGKMTALIGMFAVHGMLSRYRRDFENDANRHDHKFYRYLNEAPTVLMIIIVVMVIVKPI